MGIIRPATPGFLVTCVATVLLAVVSFCVPYIKSVYFLKANISISGNDGSITFGTLGYCLELSNGTTCSSPSVGYELNINRLVGNKLPVQIPVVVVKWLTYCLVLHIVALGLSAGSAAFGLLAHVREMSMVWCSTCISGLAATVALLAFVFDITIFFAAKARINAIGTAQLGNATWLTLVAWVLLFFSGCFFTLGRCCISRRPRSQWDKSRTGDTGALDPPEQMRLDAVKAEADRKARQNKQEVGLPASSEYQPLTGYIDGDKVYSEPTYQDSNPAYGGRPAGGNEFTGGGYVQAPLGSRAVDEYYSPNRTDPPRSAYPPVSHQTQASTGYGASTHTQNTPSNALHNVQRQASSYAPSQYAPSTYTYNAPSASPPPINQYLSTTPQQSGHTAGGSSYHATGSSGQQPTSYSIYNPHDYQQPTYNNPYVSTANDSPNTANYYPDQPTPQVQQVPARSYTLGGGSYGNESYGVNYVTPIPEHDPYYPPLAGPTPINTNVGYVATKQRSPVKGPRTQNSLSVRNNADAPPLYEAGSSNVQGSWGKH